LEKYSFLDLIFPHIPNTAQNGNLGSIQAYSLFLPGHGNRSYWGTFDPLFSDTRYTGAKSEITGITVRKTGLFIPFWLAKLHFYGLEYADREKGLFWGCRFSGIV
jgi:hypothetical protein